MWAYWFLPCCTREVFHLGLPWTQGVTGDWDSGRPRTHAHACLLVWLFPQQREDGSGMVWPRPLLTTCLWSIDTAWCALPSDPRPAWVFTPGVNVSSFPVTFCFSFSQLRNRAARALAYSPQVTSGSGGPVSVRPCCCGWFGSAAGSTARTSLRDAGLASGSSLLTCRRSRHRQL